MTFQSIPRPSDGEEEFQQRIDRWVEAVLQSNAPSFAEVLYRLPGVYPTEVFSSMERLRLGGSIKPSYLAELHRETRKPRIVATQNVPLDPIPIEHPLDFEWRFTQQAVRNLCSALRDLYGAEQRDVLCIGCPTVFVSGAALLPNLRFSLWDKNASSYGQLAESEALVSLDLSWEALPKRTAHAAILDPPWYNDFYKLFIWAATQCLPIGGHILLSFPPEGTRPSATLDYRTVADWCSVHGIEIIKRVPSHLAYRSPLFEVNALNMAGFTNVPFDWRRGDLVVAVRTGVVPIPKPALNFSTRDWHEVHVNTVRIRVSKNPAETVEPLVPVAETAIVPSVSSRYPFRDRANVVTSGNRFFLSSSPEEVVKVLDGFARGDITQVSVRSTLEQRIAALLNEESREVASYRMLTFGL